MKGRTRVLTAALVILLAAAAILIPAVLLPRLRADTADRKPAGAANESRTAVHRVETEDARRETLRSWVRLPAEVHAAATVEVFGDTGGTLTSLQVRVGEPVAEGQVLAYIDPSRPGARYEPSPVRAPITATVTRIHRDAGDRVATSSALLRLETLSALEVTVAVPERYLAALGPRTSAEMQLPALPDRTIALQVKDISPVLDPVGRSKEVSFRPAGSIGGIEPGMFGELRLLTLERADVVTVPTMAVLRRDGANVVYVIENESALERPVQTGAVVSGRVEISSGLVPGETVAVSGHQQLEHGAAARSGGTR